MRRRSQSKDKARPERVMDNSNPKSKEKKKKVEEVVGKEAKDDESEHTSLHKYSRFSWQVVIVVFGLFTVAPKFPEYQIVFVVSGITLSVVGILSAIIGMLKYDPIAFERKGFLSAVSFKGMNIPSTVGIILNSVILFIVVTNFIDSRSEAVDPAKNNKQSQQTGKTGD